MKTKFDIGEEAYLKVNVIEIHSYARDKIKYVIRTELNTEIANVMEEQLIKPNVILNEETEFVPIVYKDTPRNGYGYDAITCKKCHGEIGDNTAVIDLFKFCPYCGRKVKNARN